MIQRFIKMMNKKNKGFTLVELMVVVVIIGILVAIAVPIYSNVTNKAKLSAIEANVRTCNGAITSMQASEATPSGGWTTTNVTSGIGAYLNGGLSAMKPGAYTIVANAAATGFTTQVVLAAGDSGLTAGTYYLNGGVMSTTLP